MAKERRRNPHWRYFNDGSSQPQDYDPLQASRYRQISGGYIIYFQKMVSGGAWELLGWRYATVQELAFSRLAAERSVGP